MLKGTVEDLLANRLEINVNVITNARSLVVTVETIDGVPTSYSYQILEPEEYKKEINNIKENTYTFDKLKIDTEYKIKVIVKNKVGLTKEITKTVRTEKIDDIKLELNPKDEYIKEGTVTITYPKLDNVRYKYRWDSEDFVEADISIDGDKVTTTTPAKNGTLTAVLMDGEETIISKSLAINNVDNMAPVIEKIEGNDNVQSNRKIIKITASDSGVGEIKYSCNDGTTWQDKNECIYNQNGKQKIKVKDSLENISESNEINITTIASEETFTINNLFSNGSFETDEAIDLGFQHVSQTEFDSSIYKSGKRSLKIIPNVPYTTGWAYAAAVRNIYNITAEHIYYVTAYCKSEFTCQIGLYSTDWNSGGILITNNNLSNSNWVKLSIYYPSQFTRDFIWFNLETNKINSLPYSNPYYFDDIMVIDLTEIFGKGNEPTKEWCDKNINYNTTAIKKYNNSVDIR